MSHDKCLLSILVVDYGKSERVVQSFKHIKEVNNKIDFEFLVMNNKEDITEDDYLYDDKFHYYSLNKNIGYTKGVNYLSDKAKGNIFLILNPDILIENVESIIQCCDYLEHNNVGVVAPFQINDDGSSPSVARKFPSIMQLFLKRTFYKFGFFISYVDKYTNNYNLNENIVVCDWLQSSCIFMKRDVYKKVKGFNEKYFLFMADIDICKEVKKLGLKSVYLKTPYVVADGKRASEGGFTSIFSNKVLRIHLKDAFKYYFLR